MGKKLKFAVIALLGFSTACSSAKKSQSSSESEAQPQPSETVTPRIKVMYGVKPAHPQIPLGEAQNRNDAAPLDGNDTPSDNSADNR